MTWDEAMTWDEVLSTLVGFVGRQVHAQVWNSADPASPGAAVISTTFGILTGTDTRFEPTGNTLQVMLRASSGDTSGTFGDANGVLSLPRSAFVTAHRLDANRLEIVLGPVMLGIYAERA